MVSTLPKPNFNFSATFNLSSANAFSLDQSKNLSFRKELTFAAFDNCITICSYFTLYLIILFCLGRYFFSVQLSMFSGCLLYRGSRRIFFPHYRLVHLLSCLFGLVRHILSKKETGRTSVRKKNNPIP